MDGLSAAGNVIAVVDLAVSLFNTCSSYFSHVKGAKKEIEELKRRVQSIRGTLQRTRNLLDSPAGRKLEASQQLQDVLEKCRAAASDLQMKLEQKQRGKLMKTFGVRSFKWPFERKDVDAIVQRLEGLETSLGSALQVDHVQISLSIERKMELSKLFSNYLAKGATFGEAMDQYEPECLPNTATDILQLIEQWAEDPTPQGKYIFWLCGMAGTGKSTISRTVSRKFRDKDQLAASFFFKRDGGDRSNASKFFNTIAYDLKRNIPGLEYKLSEVIGHDDKILNLAAWENFDKLIFQPLSKLDAEISATSAAVYTGVIILDALDECEDEKGIRLVLQLLSRIIYFENIDLRILITSRPDQPVQVGFEKLPDETYRNIVLHKIADYETIVERDLYIFLKHEFSKIQQDWKRQLEEDWPGPRTLQKIVDMAIPLFIFAATICRFIAESRPFTPQESLEVILDDQSSVSSQISERTANESQLDKMYLPILNQQFVRLEGKSKEIIINDFQYIVGTILVLRTPLTVMSLSRLLEMPEFAIRTRLSYLTSVLSVPDETHPDDTVRTFHISLHDYLLDPSKEEKNPFWIDRKQAHVKLSKQCLKLLELHLHENLCHLSSPAAFRKDIDKNTIEQSLPADVQYACRNWVYHLQQSKETIFDDGFVDLFLRKHLLHWLEGTSFLEETSHLFDWIEVLRARAVQGSRLSDFILDIKRFVHFNRAIIDETPLQIYSSGIIFAPKHSLVKTIYEDICPKWVKRVSRLPDHWNALLQTLEEHEREVNCVAFSSDGKYLASGGKDKIIIVWDASSGFPLQTLKCEHPVHAVAFPPNLDQQELVSAEKPKITVWDLTSGAPRVVLEGQYKSLKQVAYAKDGKNLLSLSAEAFELWDISHGTILQTILAKSSSILFLHLVLSPNGDFLALTSTDESIEIYDFPITNSTPLRISDAHEKLITAVAFSHNQMQLATASEDGAINLWNTVSGFLQDRLTCPESMPYNYARSLAFSPDGNQLVAAFASKIVVYRLPLADNEPVLSIGGHTMEITSVAFSPDGTLLASAGNDGVVVLWDADFIYEPEPHGNVSHDDFIDIMTFSPDGRYVVSGSSYGDDNIIIWDPVSGSQLHVLPYEEHYGEISLIFSADCDKIGMVTETDVITLWNLSMGLTNSLKPLEGGSLYWMKFSPDERKLVCSVSKYEPKTKDFYAVCVWDMISGAFYMIAGSEYFAISPDSIQLATFSFDNEKGIQVWDLTSGALLRTVRSPAPDYIPSNFLFSPNGDLLLTGCRGKNGTIDIWDTKSGTLLQSFDIGVSRVKFSQDSQLLHLDEKTLDIPSMSFVEGPKIDPPSPDITTPPSLKWQNPWILRNDERLLRVPSEYAVGFPFFHDNILTLGCVSGGLIFIEVNPD